MTRQPFLRPNTPGSALVAALFLGGLVVAHQPALLVDLSIGQRVLAILIGILT